METTSYTQAVKEAVISIHSTARVETFRIANICRGHRDFNPLHREGGDDRARWWQYVVQGFQSTPPRGWRHSRVIQVHQEAGISIHSTARVETGATGFGETLYQTFQSTPPRGWRLVSRIFKKKSAKFQSTPPRGWRRWNALCMWRRRAFQSTPPRGWRPYNEFCKENNLNFNPLHREGGDSVRKRATPANAYFNPLHREGGDQVKELGQYRVNYFNPLHREGGDANPVQEKAGTAYFNPLHREGGDTGPPSRPSPAYEHFNPLHREGGDVHPFSNLINQLIISIHSTARVETAAPGIIYMRSARFQSTPPRGWRPKNSGLM